MAFDNILAERIRDALDLIPGVEEKKMFGGLAFMVNGHMCCGVVDDLLMARVGPGAYTKELTRPHAREMDFTGRPLKGFLYVEPEGYDLDEQLNEWIGLCLGFVRSLPPK